MDVSVIIPTRNRAASLQRLLASIAVVERPLFEWEVLVMDNGSTDGTPSIVAGFRSRIATALRYIRTERLGLHVGRNTGAREAQGQCLAYLDDDTVVSPAWLQGAVPVLEGRWEATAGRILPQWACDPPAWFPSLCTREGVCACLTLLDLGDHDMPVVAPSFVWGANFFVKREAVLDLGGFHPDAMPPELLRYRGDGETGFFQVFEDAGLRAHYWPRAAVHHVIDANRLTLGYFCQRHFNQGVSDSFTEIRKTGRTAEHSDMSGLRGALRRVRESTRVRRFFGRGEVDIRHRMMTAHDDGFAFHQREVRKDPALLEWVLRKDYW